MNRYQYVQIEDRKSTLLPMFFSVLQGCILGYMIFNLYVAELADPMFSTSIQYAYDTTIFDTEKM